MTEQHHSLMPVTSMATGLADNRVVALAPLHGDHVTTLLRGKAPRILLGVLSPFAVGFPLVGGVAALSSGALGLGILGIVVATGFGGAFAWMFRREGSRRVDLFDDGVQQTIWGVTKSVPYHEVREVHLSSTKVRVGGSIGLLGFVVGAAVDALRKSDALDESSTHIELKVLGTYGHIKMNSADVGVGRAFHTIVDATKPRLLDEALEKVREGETVKFGKLRFTQTGIGFGNKKTVPYEEVASLAVSGGRMTLKREGKWLAEGRQALRAIPNFMVALALYDVMRGNPSGTSTTLTGKQMTLGR